MVGLGTWLQVPVQLAVLYIGNRSHMSVPMAYIAIHWATCACPLDIHEICPYRMWERMETGSVCTPCMVDLLMLIREQLNTGLLCSRFYKMLPPNNAD